LNEGAELQDKGVRHGALCTVSIHGRPLDPRLHLRSHSPVGFDWGNDGSGSAQLALALSLVDVHTHIKIRV
jgi:hypothetical protein